MKVHNLYKELLKTGDLYEMYDGMLGNWDEDKIKFKQQQEALESFTENIEVYDEFID